MKGHLPLVACFEHDARVSHWVPPRRVASVVGLAAMNHELSSISPVPAATFRSGCGVAHGARPSPPRSRGLADRIRTSGMLAGRPDAGPSAVTRVPHWRTALVRRTAGRIHRPRTLGPGARFRTEHKPSSMWVSRRTYVRHPRKDFVTHEWRYIRYLWIGSCMIWRLAAAVPQRTYLEMATECGTQDSRRIRRSLRRAGDLQSRRYVNPRSRENVSCVSHPSRNQ